MPPEERAALQRQLDQERHAKLAQRIRGIRALNRWMPFKEIADRVGVSLAYVEDALGEKSPPAFVNNSN